MWEENQFFRYLWSPWFIRIVYSIFSYNFLSFEFFFLFARLFVLIRETHNPLFAFNTLRELIFAIYEHWHWSTKHVIDLNSRIFGFSHILSVGPSWPESMFCLYWHVNPCNKWWKWYMQKKLMKLMLKSSGQVSLIMWHSKTKLIERRLLLLSIVEGFSLFIQCIQLMCCGLVMCGQQS